MAVTFIRILALLLAVLALGLALVPMLVLIDLVTGGSGYGLCPGGIESCSRPYSTGAELLILLMAGLFGIVMAIRWLTRLARRLQAPAQIPVPGVGSAASLREESRSRTSGDRQDP